mgnify:CR=1 FL=1|jgi:hypothetical protein
MNGVGGQEFSDPIRRVSGEDVVPLAEIMRGRSMISFKQEVYLPGGSC